MKLELLGTRLVASAPVVYPVARRLIGAVDRVRVARIGWSAEPAIIVYQQGRVGSTSVYNALLRSDLGLPVLHLHTLSAEEARRQIDAARADGGVAPRNVFLSRKLARVFEADTAAEAAGGEKWRVLSIFRDPLAILVSLVMMDPKTGKRPGETNDAFVTRLADRLAGDDPTGYQILRWIGETLSAEVGIDPYAVPFDHAAGFTTYRAGNRRLVLLKFERMNEVFPDAVEALVDRVPAGLEMRHENIHRDRAKDDLAAHVRASLKLPRDYVERVYDTPFARHFYTEEERRAMIARWTGDAEG